ncbi:MAG: DnaJ family domain-containing protein [Pseudomonadota bacterium]
MADAWSKLSERQILKAQAEGQLTNLAGEGKPLPSHPEEAHLDAGEAAAGRMMAAAGALPEEIKLKQALDRAKAAHATTEGDAAKKAAMARIAEAQMRFDIAREARLKAMRG